MNIGAEASIEKQPRAKVIAISAPLHALLKAKAAREDKKLNAMVEAKLRELLEPELAK